MMRNYHLDSSPWIIFSLRSLLFPHRTAPTGRFKNLINGFTHPTGMVDYTNGGFGTPNGR